MQHQSVSEAIVAWKHPFTGLLCGPTGCGKTSWCLELLKSDIIQPRPFHVFYFYAQIQSLFEQFDERVQFVNSLPPESLQQFLDEHNAGNPNVPKLFIIDDFMLQSSRSKDICTLFTQGSHHLGISTLLILQNLFVQGPQMRNISLNSHVIVVFKNPRDRSQISTLARQLLPWNSKAVCEAYEDATKEPYGYLVLNLRPDLDDKFRMQSRIFDDNPVVYVPQKK
jgi:hypothetical protein